MTWIMVSLACGIVLVMELRIQMLRRRLQREHDSALASLRASEETNPDILPFRSHD
jgi:hypothetical protein